jgi:hypothetical protein
VDNESRLNQISVQSEREGFSQLQLGFRYNLLPANLEWLPEFAIQTQFQTRATSNDFRRSEIAPNFVFTVVKPLCEVFTLAVNYGIDYDGFNPDPRYRYVINIAHNWSDQWSTLYEVYGNEFNDIQETYGGLGLAYLNSPDFQWDIYASYGKNLGNEDIYASFGFSWRTLIF